MITLSANYFAVQRSHNHVDVYTFGSGCQPVKCVTCTSPREAILWVKRQENK